jgi:cytochrome P450
MTVRIARPVPGEAHLELVALGPIRYDRSRNSWIVSRYADVRAALAHPQLVMPDATGEPSSSLSTAIGMDVPRLPPLMAPPAWLDGVSAHANALLAEMATAPRVELVHAFAEPLAREAAARWWSLPTEVMQEALPHAQVVFESAARAECGGVQTATEQSVRALYTLLPLDRDPLVLQAFVAITQTVPAAIAGALWALLQHPEAYAWLRGGASDRELMSATDELLRFAGPSRALFRAARGALVLQGVPISDGDAITLQVGAANHDGAAFAEPNALLLTREGPPHLALGAGTHPCAGGAVVRQLLRAALRSVAHHEIVLVPLAPEHSATWFDGFSARALRTLWCGTSRSEQGRIAQPSLAPTKTDSGCVVPATRLT